MSRLAKARRLFVGGNKHLAKIGRPGTPKKRSADTLAKRQAELIRRQNERRQRGAKF
jgi:hypothetical protein